MYFGRDAAALEVVERGGQRVHPQPFLVERNADRVDAEPGQPVERAEIGDLLDDHGIAARQQDAVDEVERLQRAGGDEDVVGGAGNAGVALELGDQEFAQRPIAQRAAFEAVGRERAALAPEHGVRRLDQVHRPEPGPGSLWPPMKLYFGKPVPLRRRRRQSRRQQRGEIERGSRRRDGGGGLGHGFSGRKGVAPTTCQNRDRVSTYILRRAGAIVGIRVIGAAY